MRNYDDAETYDAIETAHGEPKSREQQMKNISGAKTNESVKSMLDDLINSMHLNISVSENYAEGYPKMEKQFKMKYCIAFHDFDDIQWLLWTTSTIRDRIYGTEFFAQNIRIIDTETKTNKVEEIYVVVPDSLSEKELENAKRYSAKIKGKTYRSFLSDVVTTNELRNLIIEKCTADIAQGLRSNIIGKDAEERVVKLLTDERNWRLWNNFELNKHEDKSDTFPLFSAILCGIGAKPSEGRTRSNDPIIKIEATDDIPKLISGGYPKTDVSFTVTFSYGGEQTYNVTIKKSAKKQVSIHEGDVSDLIKALQLTNDAPLAVALQAFQDHGSETHLRESQDEAHCADVLYSELPKYNRELALFALFGVNSPRITDPSQVADCILFINNPVDTCFWLRDKYVDYCLKAVQADKKFGTPFQWTYPSKMRGKSFQLKGSTH